MGKPRITIYGTSWCRDCSRAVTLIKSHGIEYLWIDIDRDIQAEKFVIQTNRGFRSVPTILFDDGTILVEPSQNELKSKLSILIITPYNQPAG